jgi:hypothetical protein
VAAAMAEVLDLMVSADHDAVTDYRETIRELGLQDWVWGLPGNEITSNSYGHFIVFPLDYHPEDPMGGSFDYTKREGAAPGPSHHELLSPGEILTGVDQTNSGEQVLQIAHILDKILGNFSLARLVTTPHFEGVPVLASYTDPVGLRLTPNSNAGGGFRPPYAFGSNVLVTNQFTSLELCIGHSQFPILIESSLPTYFNFLNLGKQASATCSSDSHSQMTDYVGDVRNFIRSSVDPRDRQGNFTQISAEEIAHNVNAHQMVVTTGPFVRFQVKSSAGQVAQIGDTLNIESEVSKEVDLILHIESPDWIDRDSVEIYVNTDPIPAEDDLSGPWKGTAEEFVTITPTHTNAKYLYNSVFHFQRGGGAGAFPFTQQVINGKRFVDLERKIPLSEDSWILVFVRGSDKAQSLFPYAPAGVKTQGPGLAPEQFLDTFEAQQASLLSPIPGPDLLGGFKAFAFTNPIFVDVDGDGWQAKWVREGISPLSPP